MESQSIRRQAGSSLIEVLISMVILSIGLLSLVVLHGRLHQLQMESYQRSQALVLVKDMADRINANRKNVASYITTAPRGTGFNGYAGLACASLTGSGPDLCEWHNALLGAAEKQGGANIGAMIGARGCIYQIAAPSTGVAPSPRPSPVVTWRKSVKNRSSATMVNPKSSAR